MGRVNFIYLASVVLSLTCVKVTEFVIFSEGVENILSNDLNVPDFGVS